MERVRRPLPRSRLQDPGRRTDALRRTRQERLAPWLGFSTTARTLAPRDRFIGWTPPLRKKNLPPLVIDNPRFPILPWFRIPNPGSHILALVCRRLPRDGTRRYNATPVLIETFVEIPRFTGVVYRASAWIHVETTRGRGRYDPHNQTGKPEMDVWLRSLAKRGKRILNRSSPPPRHDRTP